jgi:hypothetical protein
MAPRTILRNVARGAECHVAVAGSPLEYPLGSPWEVPGKSLENPLGMTVAYTPGMDAGPNPGVTAYKSGAVPRFSASTRRGGWKYSVPSVPRAAHGLGTEGLGRHRCFRQFLSPNPMVAWIPVGPRGCWRPGGPHVRLPPALRPSRATQALRPCVPDGQAEPGRLTGSG